MPCLDSTDGMFIAQDIKGEKKMTKYKCNSLEDVKNSLANNVQKNAQNKGVPPKETFLFYDIELPNNVPNSWDAVDLISHCGYALSVEVKTDE